MSKAAPPISVVVLAAGRGTRMRSTGPKGLQPLGGKPMLEHLLDSLREWAGQLNGRSVKICIVCAEDNQSLLREAAGDSSQLEWVVQDKPLGTGDAVKAAVDQGKVGQGPAIVLYSDVPLIRSQTLQRLLDNWEEGGITLLSMELERPHGYGRILRDNTDKVLSIVEQDDATESQARLHEVNTGVLIADGAKLPAWLGQLQKHRVGEYYLPDIVDTAQRESVPVTAVKLDDPREAFGANDRIQLQSLERYWQSLQAQALMAKGVWLADASHLQIRGNIEAGQDVFIDAGVTLEGEVRLGDGVRIGPGCVIRNSSIAANATIEAYSWLDGAEVGERATVGPFARLREGTRLEAEVRVGNFVETKNAHLHKGAKASHLSYLGDAEIGAGANIGAGVITCNYDGENKHRTQIGDGAFVGSNSALVAPVSVGEEAKVGAGSVVTKDVPAGALAVARSRQKNLEGRAGAGSDKSADKSADKPADESPSD